MSNLLSSDNLLAPLDMLRFMAAYLVVVIVPGYALTVLARPRVDRVERLALSIPCAYGLVVAVGLVTALLHLPFDLLSYAILAVPVTLAGSYSLWRQRLRRAGEKSKWWIAPIAIALIQTVAMLAIHATETLPGGMDAVMHVIWTNLIARSHIFPIALMSSHAGANDGAFYPPVFHAVTALVLNAAPIPAYRAVFYSVIATTIPLPLALYAYVRQATSSARLGGLAAIAAMAFEPLPFFIVAQSLYPFTAALLIIPALAIALHDGLGNADRRAACLAALLGIALFYTHPTEFITVALMVLAIVPGMLRTAHAWLRAAAYGIMIAAAWLAAAAPALVAVRRTMVQGAQREIHVMHDFTPPSHIDLLNIVNGYVEWIYGRNVSYCLMVAVIIGAIWCLYRRRWLGLVIAQIVLVVVFVDSYSFDLLQPFYNLSFPWALGDRQPPANYWFALPLAAIGIDAVVQFVRRRRGMPNIVYSALLTAPCVFIGLLLPFDVAIRHTTTYAYTRMIAQPADLGALAWLTHHAPTTSVAINDGDSSPGAPFDVPIDAGLWMPVLGGPQPLFWRLGAGPGSLADRYYLVRHIADPTLPPRAAHYVSQYHVRYVLYAAGVLPEVRRHLNLSRLLADPRLRLVYSSAPRCRDGAARVPSLCPATGSYVFALGTASHPSYAQIARISHVTAARRGLLSAQEGARYRA